MAERYLNDVFIPRYQERFGVATETSYSAWRPLLECVDLDNILCRRFTRKVANDNTISIQGTVLQLLPCHGRTHFIKAKVIVNQWIDGSYHVFHPSCGELATIELGKRSVRPQERGRSEPLKSSRPTSKARALSQQWAT